MEKFTLKRTGDKDLRFTGELMGEAQSSFNNASPVYSGATGRRTLLQLYRTDKGKYVCRRVEETIWQGERDFHTVAVVDTVDEAVAFFADEYDGSIGWLAAWLFEDAGIELVEEI